MLLPLFLLTVVAVAPFAWATIRPAGAVALLVGAQGLLHAALQILGRTAATAPTARSGVDTGAAVSAPASCHLMTQPGAAGSHGFAMSLMSGGHLVMLFTHLAAAVGVGVWLAAGCRAFGTVLVLTARQVQDAWRTVARVHGAVSIVSYPRFQLRWDLRCAAVSVWAAGAVSRRGPPLCCVA